MKTSSKIIVSITISLMLTSTATSSRAQIPGVGIVTSTVKRVIKAIDLKIQRMQNQTIWLQNAQKTLENELSKLRLTEITGWTGQQTQLFSSYYQELWQVKSAINDYQRIKNITFKQTAMVMEYRKAWSLFTQDVHFNSQELEQMQRVYTGILNDSIKNLDRVLLIVTGKKAQMSDEQRLELIDKADQDLNRNFDDLHRYNQQNQLLSLQRSKDITDINVTKTLYGLN